MPRQAVVNLVYEGVDISRDIAPFFVSLSYTDSGNGRADNLQITLADPDGRWRGGWMPRRGDRVRAAIELKDWYFEGVDRRLDCGIFDVDSVSYTGPEDEITISAVSYPGNSAMKNETRTRSWENVTLRQIANQIAKAAGMKLLYEMPEVTYDRINQSEETDLAFLSSQAEREGAALKVTNDMLVLFDEQKYEKQPPVREIVRGESDILSYSFDVQTVGVSYASCEIAYTDSKKKTIRGSFKVPGADGGPVLKLNERVASVAEANRKARAALRRANKDAQRATLELMGDYMLVQGVTVKLSGFGAFDDVYFVETARHMIDRSGYRTRIELRKVLGY